MGTDVDHIRSLAPCARAAVASQSASKMQLVFEVSSKTQIAILSLGRAECYYSVQYMTARDCERPYSECRLIQLKFEYRAVGLLDCALLLTACVDQSYILRTLFVFTSSKELRLMAAAFPFPHCIQQRPKGSPESVRSFRSTRGQYMSMTRPGSYRNLLADDDCRRALTVQSL